MGPLLSLLLLFCVGLVLFMAFHIFSGYSDVLQPWHSSLFGAPPSRIVPLTLIIHAPYLIAFFVLLVPLKGLRPLVAGVVVAEAAFLALAFGCLALLWTLARVALGTWYDNPPPSGFLASLWVYAVANVLAFCAAVCFSWKLPIRGWRFLGGLILSLIFAGASFAYHNFVLREANRFEQLKRDEDTAAHDAVRSIAWCAVRYRVRHPESGYPADFSAASSGAVCPEYKPFSNLPDYRLSYQPSADDFGKVIAFEVQAINPHPEPEFRVPQGNFGSDASGLVYILPPSQPLHTDWKKLADATPAGYVGGLQQCLQRYANDHRGTFPASLANTPCFQLAAAFGGKSVGENTYLLKNYLFIYSPGPPDSQKRTTYYGLQVRCQEYGKTCIRNLFADPLQIYGTPEDRPATSKDSPSTSCERNSFFGANGCHE